MRGEFVDVDGAHLYYYAAGTRGAGEPVVFLHGFPTSGHLWGDVVAQMPAGHRLVVTDLLGFGRSDPPAGRSLTLHSHAERIVGLLDALCIDRACVVGHDLGGGVAQSLALNWPARVSRLALIDSVAFNGWPTRTGAIDKLKQTRLSSGDNSRFSNAKRHPEKADAYKAAIEKATSGPKVNLLML